jgi:hypothetical protein
MSIVNVKVNNIRPQYKNLEEWMKNENNVYIARKGIIFIDKKRFPTFDSIWHNPYKITEENTREMVIEKYEKYIREKLQKDKKLVCELVKLKGKNLGCWCHPEKCHGDIILKLIEEYSK